MPPKISRPRDVLLVEQVPAAAAVGLAIQRDSGCAWIPLGPTWSNWSQEVAMHESQVRPGTHGESGVYIG
jgi:hypothetical protein